MKSGLMWVLGAFLLLAPCLCAGQSSSQGAFVGTITDPNDRVVVGATLKVRNLETGLTRTVSTDENGDYRVDFLPPGRYEITSQREGFAGAVATELILQVSQVHRVDLQLTLGVVTDLVTVDAGSQTINTETPTLGEVVNERSIQNLPLNGREFIALAGLVPGAETGSTKRGATGTVSFSGARGSYNAYSVDGADSTSTYEHTLISSPALDAIKEFRVETSLYSAKFGRAGGGIVNVVTKSGTNAFHGTLYEYHRNKALDARPYFYTGTKQNQPNYLFNQFGGTIGGPVMLPRFGEGGKSYWSGKNKTFFFFSSEFFRQVKPGQLIETFAPTAKERIGDLSDTINPYSNQKVVLRNPFTGQIIADSKVPQNLITPLGRKLMELWPEPNFNDPILNLRLFRAGTFNQNKYMVKIDHSFSERTTLNGTYIFGDSDNVNVGNTFHGDQNGFQRDRTQVLSLTHLFSQNVVNDLKVNHTTYDSGRDFVLNDKNYAKEFGVWTGDFKPNAKGVPRFLFYTLGNRTFQIGNQGPNFRTTDNWYVRDDLVVVKGTHTLSMGGDIKRENFGWSIGNSLLGAYFFGLNDGLASAATTYNATGSTFASVLMGVTARGQYDTNDGTAGKLRRHLLGLYFQDSWKATPRLTLNLGVRYDFEQPFASVDGRFMSLDFATGKPQYAAGAPADLLALLKFNYDTNGPGKLYEANNLNFAPRIGFAYRLSNDNKTAIRGGYGLVYTSEAAGQTAYGVFVVPFSGEFDYFAKARFFADGVDHFVTLDKEPYQFRNVIGSTPGTFFTPTPEFPSSYLQHWNLSVSREVAFGVAVEAAYVGSKGTNLGGPGSVVNYSPDLASKISAAVPGWGVSLRIKGFNSSYHSFQTKASKRFSKGLSFLAAFTWAHAMAEGSNEEVNENTEVDSDELGSILKRRWSNADYNVPRRFTLAGQYELPIGRNKQYGARWNAIANGFLGGWSLNLIMTLQDGRPYSVRDAAGRVPDRICNGNLPANERTPDRWYDFSCFPTHPSRTFRGADGVLRTIDIHGNAAANIINGPSINNFDLGVHKLFSITEGMKLQFRAETFNIFNHPNLIGPSGNFFVNSASGARITTARDSRDIQLALKLIF